MQGKASTDGVFGPVQASARVFIFQAHSAWTMLEATGQTEQLAPDFETWLRRILEDEIRYVRRISSVKVSNPSTDRPNPDSSRRRGLAPGGDLFVPVHAAAEHLPADVFRIELDQPVPGAQSSRT